MHKFDEHLMDTEVSIGGKVYTLRQWFQVLVEDLSAEYAGQAPRLAWLGMMEARAESEHITAKNEREREYAAAQHFYRVPGNMPAEMKVTDTAVDAMCKLDEDYQTAQVKEADALKQLKIVRAIVTAMRQRGEMLISIGATQRSEYDTTAMAARRVQRSLREAVEEAE